jgi:peptidoglycan/LPS O-acetylase OafA/YrhL
MFFPPLSMFWNGVFSVTIFFMLSGFVLPLNYIKTKKIESITSGAFKRYLRLMIPVLICISVYYFSV